MVRIIQIIDQQRFNSNVFISSPLLLTIHPNTSERILRIGHHPQNPFTPRHVGPPPITPVRHRRNTKQSHYSTIIRSGRQRFTVPTPGDAIHSARRILHLRQLVSRGQVIYSHLVLQSHRGQILTIRTELNILHRLLAVREHAHQFPTGHAPQSYCQVIGSRCQVVSVRMEVDCLE